MSKERPKKRYLALDCWCCEEMVDCVCTDRDTPGPDHYRDAKAAVHRTRGGMGVVGRAIRAAAREARRGR